eukprot:Sspe_Gene.36491::Locus_17629_Transcript_1_1_Confidence_1.000_Length_1267::g.36491::m.36491
MRSVPRALSVIDLTPIRTGGSAVEQARVVDEVRQALQEVGFMWVVGHGVAANHLEEVISVSRKFFELPQPVKEKYSMVNYRGYQCVGENVTQGKRDAHEALDFYREPGVTTTGPLSKSGNVWPAEPPEFKEVVTRHVDEMLGVGKLLMSVIAKGLNLDDSGRKELEGWMSEAFWVLRAISYPPAETVGGLGGEGCGVHTDYGFLTFVYSDGTPGALQVENVDGKWISIDDLPPDGFVVNVGDMLSRMTGGKLKATPHRVKSVPGHTRVSVPFFFEPSFDAMLRPLPHSDNDEKPVKFGDYLTNKVTNNFYTA